ncbi:MAG: segregation and condensation protein B [Candidatus Bathyarchaeum sp.]|nr:MAG: segregation and condensation protein B [Candidatus Bathyarchaeum sp.]
MSLTENEQTQSEALKKEKFAHQLALVEAGLYVAGRPLDLRTLASVAGTRSKKKARKLATTLVENYKNRETALEILELEGERFVMQLKADYTGKVRKLATRPLLSAGPLKTLSYIAFRQPIIQTQVIDVRGHHSYGHLKQLEDMELIIREGVGKKRVIKTTQFFADFFGLSHDLRAMKRQLKTIFHEVEKPKVEEKTKPEKQI